MEINYKKIGSQKRVNTLSEWLIETNRRIEELRDKFCDKTNNRWTSSEAKLEMLKLKVYKEMIERQIKTLEKHIAFTKLIREQEKAKADAIRKNYAADVLCTMINTMARKNKAAARSQELRNDNRYVTQQQRENSQIVQPGPVTDPLMIEALKLKDQIMLENPGLSDVEALISAQKRMQKSQNKIEEFDSSALLSSSQVISTEDMMKQNKEQEQNLAASLFNQPEGLQKDGEKEQQT